MISLKSGETYRVFFPLAPQPQGYAAFQRWFQFIRFIPGAYPITVEAKYWACHGFILSRFHFRQADQRMRSAQASINAWVSMVISINSSVGRRPELRKLSLS
jgi:hypothetical protein